MQGKDGSAVTFEGQRMIHHSPAGSVGQFLCIECNETFDTKLQLNSHRQSHIVKKPFMCSYCGRSFHHQVFLQMHERSHEDGIPSPTCLPVSTTKPSTSRIISTRSCRTTSSASTPPVPLKPTPSNREPLVNSIVEFKREKEKHGYIPRECATRLGRYRNPPTTQRKDIADSRSPLELRISRLSDTTVHLIDSFGNSLEILTDVFNTYSCNEVTQGRSGESFMPSAHSESPTETGNLSVDSALGQVSNQDTKKDVSMKESSPALARQSETSDQVESIDVGSKEMDIGQLRANISHNMDADHTQSNRQGKVHHVGSDSAPVITQSPLTEETADCQKEESDKIIRPSEDRTQDSKEMLSNAKDGPTEDLPISDVTIEQLQDQKDMETSSPITCSQSVPATEGDKEHTNLPVEDMVSALESDPLKTAKTTDSSIDLSKQDILAEIELKEASAPAREWEDGSQEQDLAVNKERGFALPLENDERGNSPAQDIQTNIEHDRENTPPGRDNPGFSVAAALPGNTIESVNPPTMIEKNEETLLEDTIVTAPLDERKCVEQLVGKLAQSSLLENESKSVIIAPESEGSIATEEDQSKTPEGEHRVTLSKQDTAATRERNDILLDSDAPSQCELEQVSYETREGGDLSLADLKKEEKAMAGEDTSEPDQAAKTEMDIDPSLICLDTKPDVLQPTEQLEKVEEKDLNPVRDVVTTIKKGDSENVISEPGLEMDNAYHELSSDVMSTSRSLHDDEQTAPQMSHSITSLEEPGRASEFNVPHGVESGVDLVKPPFSETGGVDMPTIYRTEDMENDNETNKDIERQIDNKQLVRATSTFDGHSIDQMAPHDPVSLLIVNNSPKEPNTTEQPALETATDVCPIETDIISSCNPIELPEHVIHDQSNEEDTTCTTSASIDGQTECQVDVDELTLRESYGKTEAKVLDDFDSEVCISCDTVSDENHANAGPNVFSKGFDNVQVATKDLVSLKGDKAIDPVLRPIETSLNESMKGSVPDVEKSEHVNVTDQLEDSPGTIQEESLKIRHLDLPDESRNPNTVPSPDQVELHELNNCLSCGEKLKETKNPDSSNVFHRCSRCRKPEAALAMNESVETKDLVGDTSSSCQVNQEVDSVNKDLALDHPQSTDEPSVIQEESDTNNKMYKCSKCDQSFRLPVLLAGHMKCHTLHLCVSCGCQMPLKYKIKRLYKKCHQCIQQTMAKRRKERLVLKQCKEEEPDNPDTKPATDQLDATVLSDEPPGEDLMTRDRNLAKSKLKSRKERSLQEVSADRELGAEHSTKPKGRVARQERGIKQAKDVPKVYKCLQCGVTFLLSVLIVKHMREHSGTQSMRCKCYEIIKRGGKHLLKKCKYCQGQTLNETALSLSQDEQVLDSPVSVSPSVKDQSTMVSPRDGNTHPPKKKGRPKKVLVLAEDDSINMEKSGCLEESFSLDESQMSFTQEGAVSTCLEESDTLPRPYVCNVCGKSFSFPRYLQLHIVMHTGIPCESCGVLFRFRRKAGRHSKKCRFCRMKVKELIPDATSSPEVADSPVLPKEHKTEILTSLHGTLGKQGTQSLTQRRKQLTDPKKLLLKGTKMKSKKRKMCHSQDPEQPESKKMLSVNDPPAATPKKRGRPPGKSSALKSGKTLPVTTDKVRPTKRPADDMSSPSPSHHDMEETPSGLHKKGRTCDSGEESPIKTEVSTFQFPVIKEEPNLSEISSFQCSECEQNFPDQYLLDNHMQIHAADRPYVCPDCGKRFVQMNHLTIHRRAHSGVRPFVCTVCNSSFRQKSSLVVHRYTHTNPPPMIVKTYECSTCGKEFKQSSELEAHECIPAKEHPFRCTDCDRCFTSKTRLDIHSNLHTGEISHSCPTCNKSFIYKANLERHLKKHKGDKPYSCLKCGVSFAYQKTLERHKLAHGKKGLFSCVYCKKYFLIQSWLLRHMKVCQLLGKGKSLKVQKSSLKGKKHLKEVDVSSNVSSEDTEKKNVKEKKSKEKKVIKRKLLKEPKRKMKSVGFSKEGNVEMKGKKEGPRKKYSSAGNGTGVKVVKEKIKKLKEEPGKNENKQDEIKKGGKEVNEDDLVGEEKKLKAKSTTPAGELIGEEKHPKNKGGPSTKKDLGEEEKQPKAKGTTLTKKDIVDEGKPQKLKGTTPGKKDLVGEEKPQKVKGTTPGKKDLVGEEKPQKVKGTTPAKKDLVGEEKPQKLKGATPAKKDLVGEEKPQKSKGTTSAKKDLVGEEKQQKVKGTNPAKKDLVGEEKPQKSKGATPAKKDLVGEEKPQKVKGATPAKKDLVGEEKPQKVKGTTPAKKDLVSEEKSIKTKGLTPAKELLGEEKQKKVKSVNPAKDIVWEEKQKAKGATPAKKARLEGKPKVGALEKIKKWGGKGKELQGKLKHGVSKSKKIG